MCINTFKKTIRIRCPEHIPNCYYQKNLSQPAVWPESWHIYCETGNRGEAKVLLFLPKFKEVFGMELLHDSEELVGSLDCQLKRLEEKIDTSQSVELMKDLHRMDDEIRHFKDVEITTNSVVSSVNKQGETIKKIEEGTRNKFTEMTSQMKSTEAMVADKHKNLISKINGISSRVDSLEEKIDLAVRELKSEARKTSVLRKLLWLD
jgi:hypothetical protein